MLRVSFTVRRMPKLSRENKVTVLLFCLISNHGVRVSRTTDAQLLQKVATDLRSSVFSI